MPRLVMLGTLLLLAGWTIGATANVPTSVQISDEVQQTIATTGAARVLLLLDDTGAAGAAAADTQQAVTVAQLQSSVLFTLTPAEFQLHRQYQSLPGLAGTVTAAGLAKLRAHPLVRAIQLDHPGGAHLYESLPALGGDFVHNRYGITGRGITVAILDSGIDSDHPALANDLVAQHCFTTGGCPPNGSSESDSAEDESGHGTHVAGVITASGTVTGFAPAADIVAVRVLDQNGSGYVSDWVAGLDWVRTHLATTPVQLVNMSLGTFALYADNCDAQELLLAQAVNQLRAQGVTIFASSGNQGSSSRLAAPACNSGVVAVGATYDEDVGRQPSVGTYQSRFGSSWPACVDSTTTLQTITCFTNSNGQLDLVAPGAPILSTYIGGGTATYWGTSQASPTAAGIAALLLERRPSLTPDQLEAVLKGSGAPLVDPKNNRPFPLINARTAIEAVSPVAPITLTITGPTTGSVGLAYAFTASLTPLTVTVPVTYSWQATDFAAQVQSAGQSSAMTFTWSTPGAKVITVTATNEGGTVSQTPALTVTVVGPTAVTLAGPTQGWVGEKQNFLATVVPPTVTVPITYQWQVIGWPPFTQTGGMTNTVAITWPRPGAYDVVVYAINAGGTVSATQSITLTAVAPAAVNLTAPLAVSLGVTQTLLATVQPFSVTTPITYVWAIAGRPPIMQTSGITDRLAVAWESLGVHAVTVTALNVAGAVSTTHQVTVQAVAPMTVTLTSALTATVGVSIPVLAQVQPVTVSLPITYVWQATNQPPVTYTAGSSSTMAYTWSVGGPVTVTVQAQNAGGTTSSQQLIWVLEERRLYLPLIRRP
ncbi:MAG: S8 family serine peptidase [Caldilineaceae bacterium]